MSVLWLQLATRAFGAGAECGIHDTSEAKENLQKLFSYGTHVDHRDPVSSLSSSGGKEDNFFVCF